MATTSIEWTATRHPDGTTSPGATWNPTTGCHKISAGCKHCYAEVMSRRLKAMGQPKYAAGFSVVKTHERELDTPKKWKKGRTIFVNSMSDLFHEDVPVAFIEAVFSTMVACPQHTFLVLTKRAERLEELHEYLDWAPNIWLGVSVEDSRVRDRIKYLRDTYAAVKFLSLEPLLGPLPNLNLSGIHWVIVGGESGPGARPMNPEWVADIQRQCAEQGVAFFFKQWGGVNKKLSGRLLNGREYNEMPNPVYPNISL